MDIWLTYGLSLAGLVLFFLIFFKLIRIVPEQQAWVVEQLGKYQKTFGPGFHLVIPVIQKIAYKQDLKEQVIDVHPQICITKDNVQVSVDGILYLQVVDAEKGSYGIDDYRFATAQLAQTTMRSEIGKIELDNSFSERDRINDAIVRSIDEASDPWGIKVTRYEIRDITPTDTVLQAMQQQVRADREKRAEILASEGDKEARINVSKGDRQQAINISKGERQKRINEAEGRAEATKILAEATAEGIGEVAEALKLPKGRQALALRIADQFVSQLGAILSEAKTSVLPVDLAQIKSTIDAVMTGRSDSGPNRPVGFQAGESGGSPSGAGYQSSRSNSSAHGPGGSGAGNASNSPGATGESGFGQSGESRWKDYSTDYTVPGGDQ